MNREQEIENAAKETLSRFIQSGMLQEIHDFVFAFKLGAKYADANPVNTIRSGEEISNGTFTKFKEIKPFEKRQGKGNVKF